MKDGIGYAPVSHEGLTMDVRGRDLVSGLPKTITLHSKEIQHAISDSLLSVLESIRATLENCPAELSGDIVDRGVILSGGGCFANGMQNG